MANIYAVVTGASSGIGTELAKVLARQGYDMILVARRRDRLEKLRKYLSAKYGTDSVIIEEDLSSVEGCKRLYEKVSGYEVEVFINNAGFGDAGSFTETDLDKDLQMIDVNVRAVHVLTKLMAGYFREKNGGYLLNVASSAGLFPAGPYMATYYATKAYVTSLTSALAEELREEGSDVYVGALCPGPVNTEFNNVANVQFALKGISPKYCAAYAVNQMFKRKEIIVPTARMKFVVFIQRLSTRRFAVKITARQQKKKIYS